MIGVGSALVSLLLMDWEEEKLYVQFSTIYLLKQTVKN